MKMIYCVFTILVSVSCVTMFPTDDLPLYTDDFIEPDYLETANEKELFLPYTSYVHPASSYPGLFLSKRRDHSDMQVNKRATLNQLLRRLVALYGNNDIVFSGRSSHVRFGAGGR